MKKWNEFGVNREADESTFSELFSLRSLVNAYQLQQREKKEESIVIQLSRIADTLERIEKKMGAEAPKV